MKMPHENVYTRLMPSKIHGVGVFAIQDIPKGIYPFKGEGRQSYIIISEKELEKIEEKSIKKLYEDFCVKEKKQIYCPKNFNAMTVGWYLNEDRKNPNMACDENDNFYTLREIKKGEELVIDYSTYSEDFI